MFSSSSIQRPFPDSRKVITKKVLCSGDSYHLKAASITKPWHTTNILFQAEERESNTNTTTTPCLTSSHDELSYRLKCSQQGVTTNIFLLTLVLKTSF